MSTHQRSDLVSFDEINYANLKDLHKARDSYLREQYVRGASLKTVRKALGHCYHTSGVNHFEDCRELAELYLTMLRTHQITGYMGYQRYDPSK
ncbi:hypothetical protein BABINDRAFT_37243 [Babjeviella inositovora NRRL Y-12698]|uniref:NADH-ubiquinone oxidoreductase 12 kDa subunit n=1 Tax=Babjeviella inositovora NRRL Y-12698 TaxID=984486 RepID=A0A1E3QP13_9ASCO|nr:uncharacterized protein BABINDRAFT_37243 [Babjeviella inositovora NRRL Y-12698]ODQ79449.1 hypothetical protein BABINDRAFT_37243 [Babjeviella inositovora NRRL Y-12698]